MKKLFALVGTTEAQFFRARMKGAKFVTLFADPFKVGRKRNFPDMRLSEMVATCVSDEERP
jgi:hypothetical protein